MSKEPLLDRVIEQVLTLGLLASAALLLAGLFAANDALLRLGIMLLMATPVARVVVVTVGMLHARDYVFALVSLWILAVLGSSLWVAIRSWH